MGLTSLNFAFFFFITVVVYYIFPKSIRWFWLLLSSMVFFFFASGWEMIPYLAYGVVVTFLGAIIIERSKLKSQKRIAVVVTVLLVLAELFAFKYITTFNGYFSRLFSINLGWTAISLVAPVGISYYSLSLIGYVVDVYRETCNAQSNILKHALFACYFPQMTSGPVTRFLDMQQLFSEHSFQYRNLVFGLERMLWGFFKKLVIADRLAIVVSTVYYNYELYPGVYVVFATICYAFQLYADFSGCMDIVLGASETFGIKLPENFHSPFFSQDVAEFWRRWHITLGLWFKDYLLYPLLKCRLIQNIGSWAKKVFGKKRGKALPTYLGLIVVWITIGVWHGGSAKFVFASGILPGFYLISSKVFQPLFKKCNLLLKINTESLCHKFFCMFRTFSLMCICFSFSRANGFSDSIKILGSMLSSFNLPNKNFFHLFDGSLWNLGLDTQSWIICLIGIFLILLVDFLKYKGIMIRDFLMKQHVISRFVILWGIAISVMLFGMFEQSQFIYFQF